MTSEQQTNLVLTFHEGQAVLADGVRITVRRITPNRVQLLLQAPKAIEIQRVREGQEG